VANIEHVEVDLGRVVHDVGVMNAGEDVPGAAHVGGELIHLVEAPVHDPPAQILLAQIADDEIVGNGFPELGKLQIHAPHPVAFILQPSDHVTADKTTRSTNQRRLHSEYSFPIWNHKDIKYTKFFYIFFFVSFVSSWFK
jgi:hypothetical protein